MSKKKKKGERDKIRNEEVSVFVFGSIELGQPELVPKIAVFNSLAKTNAEVTPMNPKNGAEGVQRMSTMGSDDMAED